MQFDIGALVGSDTLHRSEVFTKVNSLISTLVLRGSA